LNPFRFLFQILLLFLVLLIFVKALELPFPKFQMDGAFEARLGLAPNVGDKSDRSTSTADGAGEEIDGSELGHESVVLVVMDVNKELNLTAFNWALAHVIQSGDIVKLLGVLHHIINPSMSLNLTAIVIQMILWMHLPDL